MRRLPVPKVHRIVSRIPGLGSLSRSSMKQTRRGTRFRTNPVQRFVALLLLLTDTVSLCTTDPITSSSCD